MGYITKSSSTLKVVKGEANDKDRHSFKTHFDRGRIFLAMMERTPEIRAVKKAAAGGRRNSRFWERITLVFALDR